MLIRSWLDTFIFRIRALRLRYSKLRHSRRSMRQIRLGHRQQMFPIAEVLEVRAMLSGPTSIIGQFTGMVTIDGSLDAPSEVDKYTFALAHNSEVYFDSLTNNGNFNWSLSGPVGTAVSNRSFTSSDGYSIGNPVLNLVAGDYTLAVAASGQTTGAYSFQFDDLAAASILTPGTPVADTIHGGDSTNLYQFHGTAGQSFYLASQVTSTGYSGNDDYRLIDPYGNIVAVGNLSSDAGRVTLNTSGTFTLLAEGYIGDSKSVSYGLNVVPVIDPSPQPLALGSTVTGNLNAPGERDAYTFTLASNSLLYFDSLTANSNFNWNLSGPEGAAISNRSFTGSDGYSIGNPVLNLVAGDYTLTVEANGATTGTYTFRLSDLALAQSLIPGTPVDDTIIGGDSSNLYQFQATARQSFYFASHVTSADYSGNADWRLIDSYGNIVTGGNLAAEAGRVTLNKSGTYTLLAEGYIGDTNSVNFTWNAIPIIDPPAQPLTLGTTLTSSLKVPAEQDSYTFTLASNSLVYFDSLTNNGNFNLSLSGPAGTAVSNRSFTNSDGYSIGNPVLNLVAGDYTLTIDANGATTGAYSFRLSNLAATPSLTPGTPVDDTITGGDSTNLYQFQATAGQSFYFASQVTSGGYSGNDDWRLIDPYGNIVTGANLESDAGRVTLNTTGAYALLAEGYIGDTNSVSYTWNAIPVVDPVPQALTLGSTVTASLNTPSEQDAYTFTLASNALLYFDSLTNDGNFNWSLSGPDGTAVSNRNFTGSDGYSNSNPVMNLAAGDYTLTVYANAATIGAYSFRLSDLAAADPMPIDVPINGTLVGGNSTSIYQFAAASGDTYSFTSLATNG